MLVYLISIAITLVVAITVHEFSHAIVADRLGDPTPRSQGRITLNPLAHLDPMGSLMMIFAGFGWGRPVLTNPYYYRTSVRTGMAIVAVAGPLSNLLLAIVAAIPFKLNLFPTTFSATPFWLINIKDFLILFISLNLGLMLFNFLPIAPLDGFKVALGVLPAEWANKLARIEQYGPIILILVLFAGRSGFDLLGFLMRPAQSVLLSLLSVY